MRNKSSFLSKKLCSDETDSILRSLFGVFLAIALLIYKIYFEDNSQDTAYEYWSFVALFVILLILSLFHLIISLEKDKVSKSTNLIEIICIILLIFFPAYNIIRCVDTNQCFLRHTEHYATPSDTSYWVSISIHSLFLIFLILLLIFFVHQQLKKRKKSKLYEISRQQRIAKRIRDKEKRRQVKR
jgi:predicted membrane channel-forming protein YqfA (hemolysin III family)